jgi:signal transduction histidine kinase
MALHEVLATRADEIMARWQEQVRGTVVPASMAPFELLDHLPRFLSEICAALREDVGLASAHPTPEESTTASSHGEQRLRLGFSLDSVVREYGALQAAILATARDAGTPVSIRELGIVFESVVTGIAQAVTEYSGRRDAELIRQTNEHFAFIAHELRDPLWSAHTAFLLLKAKGEVPPLGHAVEALDRSLQRARDLIDHSLRAAKIASGVELRKEQTSFKALLEAVELQSLVEAEAKQVTLRTVIQGDETVSVDVRLVRSAISNLLRNGVKYTPSGGTVEVRGSLSNGRAVVEIEDCCGGLPPGKVEEAFAPFVRLDQTQAGFGLGLAIAKQAVDAHGGSIRVQNLPGKGCMFVLELPLDP